MSDIVVVFHSGYGHTQRMAQAVADGADAQLIPIDADGNLLQQVVSSGGTQYVVGAPPAQLAAANPHPSIWQPLRGTDWCLPGRNGRPKIGFHTYRHSFASNLAAAGVDQRVIDEFMGHTTEAMRKRYRHLFPRAKKSAIVSFSLRAS